MSSRTAVLVTLAAVAAAVAAQRTGLLARLGRGTTVRSVRPGAR
ncbi:hypothetical protein [Streptomyces hirsutus]|uniref:Uncharacterized protein n=1 Tax=Streptomyces hirsutus TaxID=35620 RepID=A0ABZ1GQ95_9ACTN|nr:hypothetical protein [Streptomyces hirsutus]WSD07324.1 hypothetical protein OIE73_17190 [Streptomyces hirsutus]WTD19256.1 hypothetical protein OH738_22460 [Streptomyces hirsutus]